MKSNPYRSLLAGSALPLLFSLTLIAGTTPDRVEIESGSASFEAGTNVPGIEIKGTSSTLLGHASVRHDGSGLLLEQVEVSLPVKSLATGMKVRDEHMRKYIFTAADGRVPDLEFTAAQVNCQTAAAGGFLCQVDGSLSLRGTARPFHISLSVKEQSSGASSTFHAAGDGVVKLSDYGISSPSQFGVSAANEVKLHLNLTGRPRPAAVASTGGDR